MRRFYVGALLLGAIAGCGSPGGGADKQSTPAVARFTLSSDAFADRGAIPAAYTCDGGDRAPALSWSKPPAGTRSLALVVDDPDAPGGTFRHWAAYDIPADARSLARSAAEAVNDFGKRGYGGPCPPKGDGPHRYRFKLLALAVDRLDVGPAPKVADVEAAAAKSVVGRAELTGTYERK